MKTKLNFLVIILVMCLSANLYGQSEEEEITQSEKIIQRLEESTQLTAVQKSLIEKKVQELEIDKLQGAYKAALKEANEYLRAEVLTDSQQREIREHSIPGKMIKKFEKKIDLTEDQKETITEFLEDKSGMVAMEQDPTRQEEMLVDLRKEIVSTILNDEQRSQLKAARGK